MEPCPICGTDMQYSSIESRDAYAVKCPQCGDYALSGSALVNLRSTDFTARQRANISGWLLDNPGYEINTNSVENFKHIKSPRFNERADRLLAAIAKQTEHAGQFVDFSPLWVGYSSSTNQEETKAVLSFLVESERVFEKQLRDSHGSKYKIRPNGWIRLDELEHTNADSSQGFVAMWFSDEMKAIYDSVISKAIEHSGYRPHRVDQLEHNNKIDDEIIAEIRKSRFVVADFTGHRGGVYYEAGFAKGLGMEVFWTCREDEVDKLHFDIRQYNCITWNPDNLDEFHRRLKVRIESVLGTGPHQ